MRNFYLTVNSSDLINCFDLRGETTVHTKDFAIDNSPDGEIIEHLSAVLPRVRVAILTIYFIVETINGSDLAGLMIASEKSYAIGVLHLEAQ